MHKGNNFHHMVEMGAALIPQTINATNANGTTITEPWKKARQIAFLLLGGAFPASTDTAITLQVQQRSDDSWVTLTDKNGTDVILSGTDYDDAGTLDSGAVLGSFDLSRVDSDTYKAIRVNVANAGATAAIYAIAYVLFDLYSKPSGTSDALFALFQGAAD